MLLTALLFALGLGFLYIAHRTLVAFLFAVFFAYLVDPAVSRVEKVTHGRASAILVIYVLILGLLFTFFFFVGPSFMRQTQRLGQSLPKLVEDFDPGKLAGRVGAEHGLSATTQQDLSVFLSSHRDYILQLAQRAGLRVAEAAQQSWLLILIPILAVFFLRDGQAFGQVMLSFLKTPAQREFLQGVLDDMNRMLAQFIRAQLTLAALSFLAYLSFMGLLGVSYSVALASTGGALEFIPVVGPLVAGLVIISVALLSGYPHLVLLLIFLICWRLVQDYVVAPRVMGRSVELHPLAAIFGVLAGAEVAGVLGVYLSIPVMASLRIVWRRWRLFAEKQRFGPLNEYSLGNSGQRINL